MSTLNTNAPDDFEPTPFERADDLAMRLLDPAADPSFAEAVGALTVDERLRLADTLWLDALLQHVQRPDPAARERRIRRVLAALPDEAVEISADETAIGPRVVRRSWWVQAVSAAMILAAIVLFRNATDRTPSAMAAVERSLAEAVEAPAREYRVTAAVRRPAGEREVVSSLFVQGGDRFALKHPLPLLPGNVWLGSDGREMWIAPPAGPVLVSRDEQLLRRFIDDEKVSTPFLQVTRVLDRMKDRYDLTVLSNQTLPRIEDPSLTIAVQVIRGTLREPVPEGAERWPRTIELFAEARTGVAERLVLEWTRGPQELGPRRIAFELRGQPELPADFFDHSAHHAKQRRVMGSH